MAENAKLARDAPRYDVTASVDPSNGEVDGTVRAAIPAGSSAKRLRFRFFAGLPSLDAKPSLGPAVVGGDQRDVRRSASIATISLPDDHPDRVRITLPFSYTLKRSKDSGDLLSGLGDRMSPAEIRLLSRHENVLNLGHWLPLWIPAGRSHDPEPDGFGDIGNFPPAVFSLALSVPQSWQVITGASRTGEDSHDGQTTVHAEGYGLRSLVGSVVRGYASEQRDVDGTTIRVYGPQSTRKQLGQALDSAADSLRVLEDAFGPYPWRNLDVIAAPMGAGVGGMEWSGAVWIESGILAGRMPGGVRAWTIAHEVGHQWWHIVVGNDSVQAPVVDEPLAQYSACLVMRRTQHGSQQKSREQLCDPHIGTSYTQMRLLGTSDAPALQRSDEFTSSQQYSGVIYGKVPYLYVALEDEYGQDPAVSALREVARHHAFGMISPAQLRRELSEAIGDPSGVQRMWRHWLRETHGDADVGVGSSGRGALGDLFGDLHGESGRDGKISSKELRKMLDRLLDQ